MEKQCAIVGIDVGRSNTKMICNGYSDIFKTCSLLKNNSFESENSIIIDGKKYIVGKEGNSLSNDNKADDFVFNTCLLYGLSKLEDISFNIVSGLPITHYMKYKDDIEAKYTNSIYEIEYMKNYKKNYKIINIENLMIVPEGIFCINDDDGSDVLVIDIGGFTVDVALYKDYKLINATTYDLGVRKLYGYITDELNKTYSGGYDTNDIERYVEKNKIILDNQWQDFDFTMYRASFLEKIISTIRDDFGWKKTIKKFIGGGSKVYEDLLNHNGLQVSKSSIYENAMAFYYKGVDVYGKR